jgi:hypothetical protein
VASTVLLVTSFASLLGFVINLVVMFVLLTRGGKRHHVLFAFLLLVAACWDFGIFLITIRNSYTQEILIYQNIISIPFNLFPAFIYHFTTTYLGKPLRLPTVALYVFSFISLVVVLSGLYPPYVGVISYSWGNVARARVDFFSLLWLAVYHASIFYSCLILIRARRLEESPIIRRHMGYIVSSFIVFSVAYVKVFLTYGVDLPLLLPIGILLVDSFGALIGVAVVKDHLFDVTVYLRIGVFYSLFTAVIVFVFDFSQHLVATFLGEVMGGWSVYAHYFSIALVIIVFTPVKKQLEGLIDKLFAEKKIEI